MEKEVAKYCVREMVGGKAWGKACSQEAYCCSQRDEGWGEKE